MTELAIIAGGLAAIVAIQWIWIGRLRTKLAEVEEHVVGLEAALGAHVSFLKVHRG